MWSNQVVWLTIRASLVGLSCVLFQYFSMAGTAVNLSIKLEPPPSESDCDPTTSCSHCSLGKRGGKHHSGLVSQNHTHLDKGLGPGISSFPHMVPERFGTNIPVNKSRERRRLDYTQQNRQRNKKQASQFGSPNCDARRAAIPLSGLWFPAVGAQWGLPRSVCVSVSCCLCLQLARRARAGGHATSFCGGNSISRRGDSRTT
ncbi:hypothetical protein BC826DRAFT_509773 [Russula brevipes]|nr:hypothetical protein BC826DRAFT_509773 [Russula brevipes]